MMDTTATGLVSYTMCEEVVRRDARITHLADGCYCVTLEGRNFEASTRAQAVNLATMDLQLLLERDLEGGA